jgi:hypothetical protein
MEAVAETGCGNQATGGRQRIARQAPVSAHVPAAKGTRTVEPRRTASAPCSVSSTPSPSVTPTTEKAGSSVEPPPSRSARKKPSASAGNSDAPRVVVHRSSSACLDPRARDRSERQLAFQPEERVRLGHRPVLEQQRQIGRLLKLEQEDPLVDHVRRAGGHEDRVARADRQQIHRRDQRVDVLRRDHCCKLVLGDIAREADVHVRARLRLDDDPRFRLAVSRSTEMGLGEARVRMNVQRKTLTRVQQLDQDGRVAAELRKMRRLEE